MVPRGIEERARSERSRLAPAATGTSKVAAALAGSVLIMFALGSLYAWSLFVEPLESVLAQPRSAVSAVFSIANICFVLGLLIGPRLHRRVGASIACAITFTFAAVGLAASGLWPSIWAVWAGYGGLFGLANGFGYGLSLQVVHLAMPARRGLATGIVAASYTLGSAAFALPFAWGIAEMGPSGTLLATAAVLAVAGAASAFLLACSGVETRFADPLPFIDRTLEKRAFWTLWLCFLFGSIAGVLVLGHAAAIIASLGGSETSSTLTVALVAAGNCVGRLLGGWASDKSTPRRWVSAMQFAAGLGLLTLAALPTAHSAIAALAMVGLGYGWMSGAYPALISRLFGAARMSTIYGQINVAWGLAGIGAPYLGGLLFDVTGGYRLAIVLAGSSGLAAGGIIARLRERSDREL
jgi:OFA family oxalate/formate antiporter-like MFS transporter